MERKSFFERGYEAITFDDVLLVPSESEVLPKDVNLETKLSRNIWLNIPILSAAMDTVTESELAIGLAQQGGIGIIHRNMNIKKQVAEVMKVKRYESGIIKDPITLSPGKSLKLAKSIMEKYNISGIPIVKDDKLIGILTNRDVRFEDRLNQRISSIMTKDVITANETITLDQAKKILKQHKIEKLPIIDNNGSLKGLITFKDIEKKEKFPYACKDYEGRLRVGAAVGVFDLNRVEALVNKGVDVIVVDSAHGHHKNVVETVKEIKKNYNTDVIGGNIATKEAAKALLDAGADAIKVGCGPGSICTTRVVAGIGVPQLTAIYNCAISSEVPVIADGGIKYSGDIVKAIAAGADSVMLGGLLAGVDESPGEAVSFKGRKYKVYRGMGSLEAMKEGQIKDRYNQKGDKLVPEGITGRVAYKGKLVDIIFQMVGGLRSGMGYTGCKKIEELKNYNNFAKITNAGHKESHPHDVTITVEAPNYSPNNSSES
ncbi:MAG: IMP dehydrogenase [Nanoarchaeota archaeon]|nr:IMP dehydrogenase [Nanoarchaeota archaeon]MCG2717828.1 IMP dehydrogenase [Nanoarchaeota archaeon]